MSDSRVLLLDDDPLLLQAYQRLLRRRFEVDIAQGPREGLAKLSSAPYAVVVADMLMPGLTGLEVLRQLREFAPTTVGILLTGMNDSAQILEAINQGIVFRFLNKPCPLDQLVRSIEDSLNYHHLLSQREALEPVQRSLPAYLGKIQ